MTESSNIVHLGHTDVVVSWIWRLGAREKINGVCFARARACRVRHDVQTVTSHARHTFHIFLHTAPEGRPCVCKTNKTVIGTDVKVKLLMLFKRIRRLPDLLCPFCRLNPSQVLYLWSWGWRRCAILSFRFLLNPSFHSERPPRCRNDLICRFLAVFRVLPFRRFVAWDLHTQ